MSEYQSNPTNTQESPAQQVKDTYNQSHSGGLDQGNHGSLTGGQQTQGLNQHPLSDTVQDNGRALSGQGNQENLTGGQQTQGMNQNIPSGTVQDNGRALSGQENQENLTGGQQTQDVYQTPQSGSVQDNGQAMSERPGSNQQQPSVTIQENEKPQKSAGNEKQEGGEKHAQPKNTGGTRDHIKEQPDTGELGGITGQQPVGKIDLHHL
ncbi:hypothetical protein K450DRAFT_245065 [Umbelopsis ramanniana AG]|uniref:Uncharacterized protein n=1 Tax=Umbelopsis ramanniana AG TaxID=1314678 RepID=A0AAD5E8L7_UMBRA|nr:uncharacterized protein K450DRAFT_245065 [Umbelopsis ramanniana AG]KAI8578904.1 hypothetical protein K450DRAFT_245065 [Umbelopsis ramanniana AG]